MRAHRSSGYIVIPSRGGSVRKRFLFHQAIRINIDQPYRTSNSANPGSRLPSSSAVMMELRLTLCVELLLLWVEFLMAEFWSLWEKGFHVLVIRCLLNLHWLLSATANLIVFPRIREVCSNFLPCRPLVPPTRPLKLKHADCRRALK